MKKKIFCFILLCLMCKSNVLNAQVPYFSPERIFDSTVCDKDGMKYKLNNIRIDTTTVYPDGNKVHLLCSSGYFDLYFEPGCGMENTGNSIHNARRAVICQLFTDLSSFVINKGGNSNKVRIFIRDMNKALTTPTASSSGMGAAATSYYTYPYAPTKSGIIDSEIWKTINSGQDSYIGIASPLMLSGISFYHGQMFFNFYNTSFSWHDNLLTTPPVGMVDLYTIGLHEAVHALGFSSGINFNGNSLITFGSNYFTRYDLFLKTQSGLNLITNSGGCSMYNYSINPAFSNPTYTLSPGGATCSPLPSTSNSDNTSCPLSITYSNTSQNVNVYTPNCYEVGSSLSHFEDMCYPTNTPTNNNQYFVMSNQTGNGQMKRFLKEEERKVLCDIGYSVAATYGTPTYTTTQKTYTAGACNGLGVVGINDGLGSGGNYTYVTTINVAISGIQPLVNDVGTIGGTFECLEPVFGTGTVSNVSGTIFTYTPTSVGLHVLRYVPKNSGGTVKGNITYIYIKVNPTGGSGGCTTPNNCEMVYNGGFENSTPTCGNSSFVPAMGPFLSCWDLISGYFNNYIRNCNTISLVNNNQPINWSIPGGSGGVDTWNGSPNNSFIKMDYFGSLNNNIFQTALTTSLLPTSQYKISFWAYIASGTTNNLTLAVASSTAPVSGPILPSPTLPGIYTMLNTFTVVADGNWHHYSAIITYTGSSTAKYISLIPLYTPNPNAAYFLLDDVSIIPSTAISTFSLPAFSCTGTSYTLNPLVSVPNGTFTGSGVSLIGSDYVFNPSAAGNGIKTISYTYTTASGCTLTAYAQTQVYTQPTVSVLPNPGSICPGTSSLTYTATGAMSYTWASASQTVIGNPATLSPTATTIFTLTGVNGGCSSSTLVTVNVYTACICSFDPDISYLFPSSITIVGSSHSGAGLPRYSINNNITVTGNVGFYSAEFAIAPNVSITVASGGTLTINKCHLYACNNMWQGIVVQNGGYLIIESDALIEDAIEAVSINSNTNTTGKILTVNTAIFNNNYKAISVSTYTQAITNYPFEIVNSIFTGRQFTVSGMSWPTVATLKSTCSSTNNLTSPYCLQNAPVVNLKAPNNTTSARFGVYLNNIGQTINPTSVTPTYYDIVIGDYLTQGNFNIFDNLYFGIYGIDANVQCYNNVLQNTRYTGSKGNFTGGMGISLNSSTLNINSRALLTPPAPYHLTRKNKFYNCTYGLLAGNYFEMKADYMEFRSTQTASGPYQQGKIGIYLVTNRFKKYDVNNNLIYNIENGIIFNTTYGPIKFGATTFTNTQYAGPVNIFANSISPVSSGSITTEFVSNAISTQNILSAGSTQTVLAGAIINENGNAITNAYKGIYGSDFNNPKVISQSNYITLKANPAGGSQYGIKLVAGTSPTITLNNISGASGLATNTLVTSIQTEQNNAPSVTCNTVSSTGQGFEFSKSQPNSVWKGNSMTNHSRGMVLNYTATIGQQGSAGNPIDNTWNGSWPFGTYNTWTDNGTFASNTNTLYVKSTGVYFPTNNSGMPIPNSYQSCCIFTTTGTYYCGGGGGGGGSMMMSSSSTSSSGNTQTLDKISQDNSDFIAQYQLYSYLKENPSIKNSSIKLSTFYSSNNNSTFGKLSDIEEELAKGNYAVASGKINTLNATNSIVNNYKSFFNIYLSYVYNTINLSETNDLENLANKCPFTEGAVVYKARALYNIINKTFSTFNDNCPVESFENARFNSLLNNKNQQWQVSIFPNPASEEINISCSENENLNLEIRDVTGKVVLKKVIVIENNLHQLKVDLKSGIYFVNLINTNGQQFSQKLIITK